MKVKLQLKPKKEVQEKRKEKATAKQGSQPF